MTIGRDQADSGTAADVAPLAERRALSAAPLVSARRDRIRRKEGSGRMAIVQALAAVSVADVLRDSRAARAANAAAERPFKLRIIDEFVRSSTIESAIRHFVHS